MAKLTDKFFNRVIEGKLEVGADDVIAPEAVGNDIANGNVSNAKPIYFHPVYIYYRNSDNANIAIGNVTILDNTSTKYNFAQVNAKLKQLMDIGALITMNGVVKTTGEQAEWAHIIYMGKESSNYQIVGVKQNGDLVVQVIDFENLNGGSEDGVNKIN